ncbi:MAG: divalent-cation tolerance protein CutA [Alphaproteobacteria bacterium]
MAENAGLVYVTCGSKEEADRVARVLLEEELIACANIIGNASSLYRWKGKVVEDTEAVLIAKTKEKLVRTVTDRIKSLHSYDCPCIVSLAIEGGNSAFLEWVNRETI